MRYKHSMPQTCKKRGSQIVSKANNAAIEENPFKALDRIQLSAKGFSGIEKLFKVKLPSLADFQAMAGDLKTTEIKALRDAYLSAIQGKPAKGIALPETTAPKTSETQAIVAAIVNAWVGLELPDSLFNALSKNIHFTHSQRLHDARVNSGCRTKPLPFMSAMLGNSEIDAGNNLAVTCRSLINGAFDSTRGCVHSGMFLPLITKVLMVDDKGCLQAELLQTLIQQCLADPYFKTAYPDEYLICSDVMALLGQETREKHAFDKIILSPEVEPRAFAIANPIYQPVLKKVALENVGIKLAKHLDAEAKAVNAQAEKENDALSKKTENLKLSGAYSAKGLLAPHSINNPVNGGGALNAMAGRYATPILLPPSLFNRRSAGQEYSYALNIAELIDLALTNPQEHAKTKAQQAVAKNLTNIVVGNLFKEVLEQVTAIAYSYQSTFNDLEVNAKKRKALTFAGADSYTQYKDSLKALASEAFIASVAAKLNLAETDKNAHELAKTYLGSALELALKPDSFSAAILRKFNFVRNKKNPITAEHTELFNKGITSQALGETNSNEGITDKPVKLQSSRAPVTYTDGLTTALHLRIKAENCTLYGGLTAGIPSFTAQHGLVYKTLTVDNGIDFEKSLMIIHDIAPQFVRSMHRQKLTAFRDKQDESQWNASLEGSQLRPFLSGRDKPADKEPLQSTFEGDCEISIVVAINPSTLSNEQLEAIQHSLMAGRFSGGTIASATVANIVSGANNTEKYYHEKNWQLPQGYLLKSLLSHAVGVDNMMERMMAHNLFCKGERLSDILPELKFEGAKAAFGFAMAGVMDLGVNENSKVSIKGNHDVDCNFAEPIFFPVELSHTRHLTPNGLLSHDKIDGDPVQWVSYDKEVNLSANSYILTVE